LAERRFGGDSETQAVLLSRSTIWRDRVLDGAQLAEGDTLLDVGCGEGLIGFGALERGAGRVIFSDISAHLLNFCREAASDLGVIDRCAFVEAAADDLGPIADSSVDVVTTRSVLIYVKNKAAAFAEFARVLHGGGRISLFEPINRFASEQWISADRFSGYDVSGLGEIGRKLRDVFARHQPPDSDPMFDFDERDLVRLAEADGFFPIRLAFEAVIEPTPPRAWDAFLGFAANPNVPTAAEAIEEALTPSERDVFVTHLQPLVEQGVGEWRMALAYLTATKPTDR
jgi:ubiquinone/menaquinone biosynthesis C-methylase UbiE